MGMSGAWQVLVLRAAPQGHACSLGEMLGVTLGPLDTQVGNVLESRNFLVPTFGHMGGNAAQRACLPILAFYVEVFAEPSFLA